MEENKINNIKLIEKVNVEEATERLVVHNGKWVNASKFRKEISEFVDTLTSTEREMCLKHIYLESTNITLKLSTFLKKVRWENCASGFYNRI